MSPMEDRKVRVGVLALQGSFREHLTLLNRIEGVDAIEVRTPEELHSCAGLVIPGGESTAMALIAEQMGIIEDLRKFCRDTKRPVWGTCAGMIFLCERCTGEKKGGQALLGGLDATVCRNFFGAQVNSFEAGITPPICLPEYGEVSGDCRALFIRAPAFVQLGSGVENLGNYVLTASEREKNDGLEKVCVACRSDHILATAFHPELTADMRWHKLFVDMVLSFVDDLPEGQEKWDIHAKLGRKANRPEDLPVFGTKSVFDTTLLTTPTYLRPGDK